MTQKTNKQMVMVSCETLTDLHLAAYNGIEHEKYPATAKEIMAAQEESRQALLECGWWTREDEDSGYNP